MEPIPSCGPATPSSSWTVPISGRMSTVNAPTGSASPQVQPGGHASGSATARRKGGPKSRRKPLHGLRPPQYAKKPHLVWVSAKYELNNVVVSTALRCANAVGRAKTSPKKSIGLADTIGIPPT